MHINNHATGLVKARHLQPILPLLFSRAFYSCHTVRQRTGPTKPSAVLRVLRLSWFLSPFSLALDDRLMSRYRHLPTPRHRLPHVSPSPTALHLTITNRSTLSLTAPCLAQLPLARSRSLEIAVFSPQELFGLHKLGPHSNASLGICRRH